MLLGWVALYLLIFFACALHCSKREGFWAPLTVFGISAFYYYLSVPLELFVRGEETFTTYPSTCGISPETGNRIAVLAILALLGFAAGHHCSGLGKLTALTAKSPAPRVPKSLQYAAVGTIALLFLLYRTSVFDQLAYEEANERRFNDPVYSYLTRMCLQFGCLIAGVIVHRRGIAKLPALLIVALAVGWGLHTSDKDPLLRAALAVSALMVGHRSRSVTHFVLYCAAALFAIGALPVFSAFRAHAELDVRKAATEFSVLNTDAKGPMISLVSVLEDESEKMYGQSYLFAAAAWIPRSIWPSRPDDLAQQFALQEIPNWQPGMGLGYSLLAEAYLNFGYAGAFGQYFLLAYGLGRLWAHLYTLLARRGAVAYWRAILTSTYFAILIIMHRVPISYVPQTCIFELLIPAAAAYWFDARLARRSISSKTKPALRSISYQPAGAPQPTT
jgi:hypothetical protein